MIAFNNEDGTRDVDIFILVEVYFIDAYNVEYPLVHCL